MAMPAPGDGQLRDGHLEGTGVVLGLVRIVNGLSLHQVAESFILGVPFTGLLVKEICQLLWQGVDVIRALPSRFFGVDSFHIDDGL